MQPFEYASPKTVKEALALLGSKWGEVEVLAGGTDLLALMKDSVATPKRLVNIKEIAELKGVTLGKTSLRLGAAASMEDVLSNASVRKLFPSLHQAARGISSAQVRNVGTVGGDLCQRPRCWYFRGGFGLLAMKGGRSMVVDGDNRYHAIFGAGPAHFVSPSSLGPALIALGATIKVAGAGGERSIAAAKFFVAPPNDAARETALLPNELVTAVEIPLSPAVKNATYEVRQKEALDWPLATASVALTMKGSTVGAAKVVLGHVAATPWASEEAAAAIAGKSISEETAEAAGKAAVAAAKPLSGNGYKVQLAKVAVKRALLAAVKV
jgi:xanthine dehydrogenase YagS FAD-binding subunit